MRMRRSGSWPARQPLLSLSVLVALAAACNAVPGLAAPPGATFNILDFGGVGDGATDNTAAFAKAVAAVAAASGGTLVVPAGTFVTRAFNLTSSMLLLLQSSAVIQSSVDFTSWPLVPALDSFPGSGQRYAPLIGGEDLKDVHILGNASAAVRPRIDGAGLAWAAAYELKLLKGERPHAVEMLRVAGFELGLVDVIESAFWSVHPVMCVGVWVHDLSVLAATPNGDGVDPDGSQDVLIERVRISTADDAIAIKSGDSRQVPNPFPPARNITIRDSVLSSGEACVAIGSEMTAGVSDVVVGPNVTCSEAGHGVLYIKEAQDGGGYVRDVLVFDVSIAGPVERFLWLSQHFGENGEKVAAAAAVAGGADPTLPVLANITLRDIGLVPGGLVVEPALLNGARAPPGVDGAGAILGVTLENIFLGATTLQPWSCANASGVFRNVTPAPATCPQLSPE